MNGHFIARCGFCGVVIAQCRCPSKDKTVRHSVCDNCKHIKAQEAEFDRQRYVEMHSIDDKESQ